MRGAIEEAARFHLCGVQHDLVGHRKVAVEAGAGLHAGAARFAHGREAPDRDASCGRVAGGKEGPVVHCVTERAVGDVVRGQRESIDAEAHCARFEWCGGGIEPMGAAQIGTAYGEGRGHIMFFRFLTGEATRSAMVTFPGDEVWPSIGLGTWRMGESAAKRRGDVAVVCAAIEIGYRVIDTAEMYGEGGAEEVVGSAVAECLRAGAITRDELFIVSKVYPHNASAVGTPAACERSLKRLGLDRIDCYLLHWRGAVPLAETVAAF